MPTSAQPSATATIDESVPAGKPWARVIKTGCARGHIQLPADQQPLQRGGAHGDPRAGARIQLTGGHANAFDSDGMGMKFLRSPG